MRPGLAKTIGACILVAALLAGCDDSGTGTPPPPPMSEARLQQNIQTIQNNPAIPEAQKEVAVNQMRAAYDMQHKMANAAKSGQTKGHPHP